MFSCARTQSLQCYKKVLLIQNSQLQRQKFDHVDDGLRSLRRVFDEFFICRSTRSSTFNFIGNRLPRKSFRLAMRIELSSGQKKREGALHQSQSDVLIRRFIGNRNEY